MTRATRHRRNLLHWLTTVSLMLALVLQPTLAAIGELHELGHGLDETHLASEDHEAVTDEVAEHGESGDRTAGFLHVIHHVTHCCGQVAVPAFESHPAPVQVMHAAEPNPFTTARPANEPLLGPFRPPIRS
jgi:hypothetical protein